MMLNIVPAEKVILDYISLHEIVTGQRLKWKKTIEHFLALM